MKQSNRELNVQLVSQTRFNVSLLILDSVLHHRVLWHLHHQLIVKSRLNYKICNLYALSYGVIIVYSEFLYMCLHDNEDLNFHSL